MKHEELLPQCTDDKKRNKLVQMAYRKSSRVPSFDFLMGGSLLLVFVVDIDVSLSKYCTFKH